jgi:soluble P-type ATPase
MLTFDIPGYGPLNLEHLVLDYNGTIAVDGEPVPGVRDVLADLSRHLSVHVLTADTFGRVREAMAGVNCRVSILPPGNQDLGKRDYIASLGPDRTVSIGNGRNDRLMLKGSKLGIAVILGEGAAAETLAAADIVCTDILAAMALLIHPLRLTATLRS